MTEEKALVVHDLQETMQLGKVLAESGFFSDSRQAAQAVVKVLAGQELGFGPVASMTGIHIIQGKPAVGAHLLAAAVKRSGKYNYKVAQLDDEGCEIAFFDRHDGKWAEMGRSSFSKADAQRAGLLDKATWKQFPRNLYFARALSNGVRWYCPDATMTPVYTPEELGATVDGDGDVIDIKPTRIETQPEQQAEPEPEPMTASRLLQMLNEKVPGYYQVVNHVINAVRIESGNPDLQWPESTDIEAWRKFYQLALSHAKKAEK